MTSTVVVVYFKAIDAIAEVRSAVSVEVVTEVTTAEVGLRIGPPGIGADGADGKSAYQVALDNGFVGSQPAWLASLKGEDGGASGVGFRYVGPDEPDTSDWMIGELWLDTSGE